MVGVRVNCIVPGAVATPLVAAVAMGDHDAVDQVRGLLAQGSLLKDRAGVPEDVAEAALYLASDSAGYVTGHALVVDAGQTSASGANAFVKRGTGMMREAGYREA